MLFSFSTPSDEIDVKSVDRDVLHVYDEMKARNLMTECQRNVNFARIEEVPEEWEEKISR